MYELKQSIIIDKSLDEVFEFFNRPENLEVLTPPFLKFRILTPSPISMQNGAVIDYTISLFGIPMHWRSIIEEYNPPHKFVDTQLKGPYLFWHHTHEFKKISEHKTEVIDHVRYKLPFGIFGKVAHSLMVKRQLKHIFGYRITKLHSLFGH